jgi:hypothetical protein
MQIPTRMSVFCGLRKLSGSQQLLLQDAGHKLVID